MRNLKLYLFGLGILLLNFSCGKSDPTVQNFHVTVNPNLPVVFLAPLNITYNAGGVAGLQTLTIPAPWATFFMNVTNDSDQEVTIIAITFTGTSIDSTGNVLSYSQNWGSSSAIPPTAQTQSFLFDLPAHTPIKTPIQIYLQGLPNTGTSTTQGTTSFSITAQMEGWIGDNTHPQSRFEKYFYFTTQ